MSKSYWHLQTVRINVFDDIQNNLKGKIGQLTAPAFDKVLVQEWDAYKAALQNALNKMNEVDGNGKANN